jgi:cytochrome c553
VGRDDEVWAMVAFLRQLPNLDNEAYRIMVYGEDPPTRGTPEVAPIAVTESCARCHGSDGLGRGAFTSPKPAGQRFEYLAASLTAYAGGVRHSGIMESAAADLDPTDVVELARYYADLPRPAATAHRSELGIGDR